MRKLIYLSVILLLFYSCSENVSFEKAQPVQGQKLNQIPLVYHGVYFDPEDSSKVEVRSDMIVQYDKELVEVAEPLDSILSDIDQEPDVSIISRGDGFVEINLWNIAEEKLEIRNDSVYGLIRLPQILFSLKKGDILKQFNGCQFFNVKDNDDGYYLRKVNLDENILTISKIDNAEDLPSLSNISSNSDKKGKRLRPTKKQFRRINQNSFNISRELKKVE